MANKNNKNKTRKSRGRNSANNRSHVVAGQQELQQIVLGTPSGTFVGGRIPLIPTFEPTSRLGVLALQYSQFSVEASRVSFVSQTTTSTTGRLVLAWTFDSLDADPVNNHQLLQISRAVMTRPWQNISTAMPRNAPEKRRFPVIDGPSFVALEAQDKQIYLPATLVFGSDSSAQSGLTIGTLVWHYRIRFFNPNSPTGVVAPIRNLIDLQREYDAEDHSED